MGREMTVSPSSFTMGSGEEPTIVRSGKPHEVHVRARVHLSQHAVVVERIGVEIEREPLGQHHLEDVAGEDVFLRHLDRAPIGARAHRRPHLRQLVVDQGRLDQRFGQRSGTVGRQLLEPLDRFVVHLIQLVVAGIGRDEGVRYQGDALAEVIERRELPDDRQDRVGIARVVVGNVREMLDLAHDVVAEISHQPAVQGWKVIELRRSVALEHAVDRGEDPVVEPDAVGHPIVDRDLAPTRHERGGGRADQRMTTDSTARRARPTRARSPVRCRASAERRPRRV